MSGVKRERDGSVGVLTLDEPVTLNAMTPDLLGDLAVAIGEMTGDPEVRALVLTGAGRGFSAGGDMKARATGAKPPPSTPNTVGQCGSQSNVNSCTTTSQALTTVFPALRIAWGRSAA
jgi:enoyl-CoA hydratase/carnithine racemase